MKPRQIKKNSKSAMDLLIKLFGARRDKFHLMIDDKTKIKQWFLVYTSICKTHAIYTLSNQLFCETAAEWLPTIDGSDSIPINGIDLYGIELISYCRKLAKAGVTFK